MKRRTMIVGSIAAVAGVSGLVGYRLGIGQKDQSYDPKHLHRKNPNVDLSHLSTDTLMKLHSGILTDADAPALEAELLRYNRALYAPTAVGRRFGEPGFFGIK